MDDVSPELDSVGDDPPLEGDDPLGRPDESVETPSQEVRVSPPKPPDDPDAWYAESVRTQDELHPGVVATIVETDDGFDYRIREPPLSPAGRDALDRVEEYFADANLARPLTREGASERMEAGFDPKYRRIVDRLTDLPPGERRRVEYYALRDLRCLGELTPLALDDGIEVADAAGDRLVVHTDDYAPADTHLPADADHLERFASERVETHAVEFRAFRVPVVVYREHLLASDSFTTKYAVQEPDLLPGDEELIRECKERIWEFTPRLITHPCVTTMQWPRTAPANSTASKTRSRHPTRSPSTTANSSRRSTTDSPS
ncbi:hypothetical protein [Halorussus halobius]|uniref:hypothetical protein n=1 Tax=Halorussus halobius TaxID=1710537 RepID=UPI001FCEEEA9|nr:hypothetical protein [Halorussus halobius]